MPPVPKPVAPATAVQPPVARPPTPPIPPKPPLPPALRPPVGAVPPEFVWLGVPPVTFATPPVWEPPFVWLEVPPVRLLLPPVTLPDAPQSHVPHTPLGSHCCPPRHAPGPMHSRVSPASQRVTAAPPTLWSASWLPPRPPQPGNVKITTATNASRQRDVSITLSFTRSRHLRRDTTNTSTPIPDTRGLGGETLPKNAISRKPALEPRKNNARSSSGLPVSRLVTSRQRAIAFVFVLGLIAIVAACLPFTRVGFGMTSMGCNQARRS